MILYIIFKHISTTFDKEIVFALTQISNELEKYFEERNNTIRVLWKEDIVGHQFVQG